MLNIAESVPESEGVPGIPFNSVLIQVREFLELVELDQFRLGRCGSMMTEFQELERIDSGGGTDSIMFNIAE
jgi:hypothetical protein